MRGYTRKVGLRKPEWGDTGPDITLGELIDGTKAAAAFGLQPWLSEGLLQVVEQTYRRDLYEAATHLLDDCPCQRPTCTTKEDQ